MKKFKLENTKAILEQFSDESQKNSMQAILESVEAKVNDQILTIAKKLNERSKKHFSELYSKRAKNFLAKQESTLKIRQENLVKIAMAKWLKENKIAAVSHIRAAKAERAESLLNALVSKFYVGAPTVMRESVEKLKEELKTVRQENKMIHKALTESKQSKTVTSKKESFKQACEGLAMTQKEKMKVLAEGLSKDLTAEAFAEKMKSARSLVISTPTAQPKTESNQPTNFKTEKATSSVLSSLAASIRG